jgi:hypothetical protein
MGSGRCGNFRYLAVEYPIKRRLLLALLSFSAGSLLQTTATILIGLASNASRRDSGLFEKGIVFSAGAFVSAIVAVRIGSGCITVLKIRAT